MVKSVIVDASATDASSVVNGSLMLVNEGKAARRVSTEPRTRGQPQGVCVQGGVALSAYLSPCHHPSFQSWCAFITRKMYKYSANTLDHMSQGKRAEVGTPKYLANAMKSKGLQRLRWYCQVCQKQCRDENGFKCHTQSEGHLRQMLVVGESAGKHIHDYSMQFQSEFVALLSRRYVHFTLLFSKAMSG